MSMQQYIPLDNVCKNVKSMTNYNSSASKLVNNSGLSITNVSWEDCARNKGSCWGPNISDMTLKVNNYLMPVIRENNFKDKTWDVNMDKIPIVVGNEKINKGKLETITLREYLQNFDKYITQSINNDPFAFMNKTEINLAKKVDNPYKKMKDTHVIMSSQCCFLPVEKGKETKFNVALFNYQSRKDDPAVLCIVSTNKGTSAQIIESGSQDLLFNNNGTKGNFIAQRLKDNRKEKGLKLEGAMSKQEKQENCLVIIQVPLKQKPKPAPSPWSWNYNNNNNNNNNSNGFNWGSSNNNDMDEFNSYENQIEGGADLLGFGNNMAVPQQQAQNNDFLCDEFDNYNNNNNNNYNMNNNQSFSWGSSSIKKKKAKKKKADVEAAIIKVVKTKPLCKCGSELTKLQKRFCYNNNGIVNCDICGKAIKNDDDIVWHCPKEKTYIHQYGYDMCSECGKKALQYKELNNLKTLERDYDYPIRCTIQYYKSTSNGVVNKSIIENIAIELKQSVKQSDFIGSLVVPKEKYFGNIQDNKRPTNFDKKPVEPEFKWNLGLNNNNNNNNNNDKDRKILNKCLNELNLKELYNNFIVNDVKDDILYDLVNEEAMLKELVPKIGQRVRFKNWILQNVSKNNNKFMDGFFN